MLDNNQLRHLIQILENEYIVIIADGAYPKKKFIKDILIKAKFKIACDGATNKLIRHGIIPNWIIGDLDTINTKYKNQFIDKIIHIKEQNTNDLTKAFNFIKNHRQLRQYPIIIIGATGMREDHSIANIGLLGQYQANYPHDIIILSDYGIFRAITQQNTTINTLINQNISFFTNNPNTIINCHQLVWQLNNHQCANWNNGTLNRTTDNQITIETNNTILIYLAFS
jgi:thiamine pyrophosphokinase